MTKSWSRRVDRSDYIEVGWFCPRQPYLEIQIPDEAISVQRLVITTVSHDQGSSDHEQFHGTYDASCSFFEVMVVTSELHERAITKHFQNNLHGSREARKHVNTWDIRLDLSKVEQQWLSSFRAGDYIQVVAGADFLGWTNHVYEVSIEIEGEKREQHSNVAGPVNDAANLLYQPLDRSKHEVRMLLLYPGSEKDSISCSINTVSLDSLVEPYVALSYCWGDPDRRKIIHVRDYHDPKAATQELKINNNLFEALSHLRSGIEKPFWLWADAICINQQDLKERSDQVTLIQTIYNTANSVTIWLGPSNDTRKACFATIREVEDRFHQQLDRSKAYTANDLSQMSLDFWVDHTSGEPCMEMSREWRKSDFDWFNRTWVLQEISNAKSAIVRCGEDILTWSVIARFADAIRIHKERAPLIRYGIMPSIFLNMTRSNPNAKDNLDILEVLIQTLGLKASDRRDRIFAMLQFGGETRDLAKVPLSIRPDYGKTVQQVFTDFVRWWICEHKSLKILSMIHTLKGRSWQKMYYGRPTDLENLNYPSWSFWYKGHVSWATGTLALTPNSSYRAGGSSIPDAKLILSQQALVDPGVLQVRGYRMCVVWQVSQYETESPIHLEEWKNSQSAIAHASQDVARGNDDVEVGNQSESRNTTEDNDRVGMNDEAQIQDNNKLGNSNQSADEKRAESEGKQTVTRASKSSGHSMSGDSFPVNDAQAAFENIFNPTGSARTWIWDKDDQVIQKMTIDQEMQSFFAHLQYHQNGFEGTNASFPCYSRCRMIALKPNVKLFHGLVPHLARPGDVVVLLNGGPVFYLLRESKKHATTKANTQTNGIDDDDKSQTNERRKSWILVGECFLDDRMNGEALKEIDELGIAEEIFDLV